MSKINFLCLSLVLTMIGCAPSGRTTGIDRTEGYTTTPSGLKYKILQQGSGESAIVGNEVYIRETTSYLDGTVLYSNEHSGSPVKVLIGGNQATNAVDEGLRGMKVGEVRYLVAAPQLVKRTSYPDNVSPDSTLAIKLILVSFSK